MADFIPEEQRIAEDRYRFSAFRYGLRSPDTSGPNDIVMQISGSYAFPRGEEAQEPSLNLYESNAPL